MDDKEHVFFQGHFIVRGNIAGQGAGNPETTAAPVHIGRGTIFAVTAFRQHRVDGTRNVAHLLAGGGGFDALGHGTDK